MRRNRNKDKLLNWFIWFGSIDSEPVEVGAYNKEEAERKASAKANLPRSTIVHVYHVGKPKNLHRNWSKHVGPRRYSFSDIVCRPGPYSVNPNPPYLVQPSIG